MIDQIYIENRFAEIFNNPAKFIIRSPGRINVIGEHTDYHQGFVLPAAIDKNVYVAIRKNNSEKIRLYSESFSQHIEMSLQDINPSVQSWANYILGVVDEMQKLGHQLEGFDLYITGDVPLGAGLSSSAAVECATGFAINELFSLNISRIDLAKIGQQAEHHFAGVMCGIMDQFASLMSLPQSLLKLDCRSLDYEHIPLELGEYTFLLLNTNISHALDDSEYNNRRAQSEQGVEWIQELYPHVQSLRDTTPQMLKEIVLPKDKEIYTKCQYVVEENRRLLDSCEALKQKDLITLGLKMYGSHQGLSEQYKVSCDELDFLVGEAKMYPDVLGARMMGGGFGGCTINLIKEEFIPQFIDEVSQRYRRVFPLDITPIPVHIAGGTAPI